MDGEDSDDERTRYYEDKNSTYESTNWSNSSYSPRLGSNGRPMIKASRARNATDVSQFVEGPKPFYNSVNKNFASNSGITTVKGSPEAKTTSSARKHTRLTLPKEAVTFTNLKN